MPRTPKNANLRSSQQPRVPQPRLPAVPRVWTSAAAWLAIAASSTTQAEEPPEVRKALLVAVHSGDPSTQTEFRPLLYPTLDVVRMYGALRAGKGPGCLADLPPFKGLKLPESTLLPGTTDCFTNVRVLASYQDLLAIRDGMCRGQGLAEACQLVPLVEEILRDPNTPSWTRRPDGYAPPLNEIKSELEAFRLRLNEEDEGLFYVSSHGFRKGSSAWTGAGRLLSAGDVHLLAGDSKRVQGDFAQTLRLSQVITALEGSAARRVAVIHASCARTLQPGEKGSAQVQIQLKTLPPNQLRSVTVIGAARDAAFESLEGVERGDIFTRNLVMAMYRAIRVSMPTGQAIPIDRDGDGAVSLVEAYAVAEQRTLKTSGQRPYSILAGDIRYPFVLAGVPHSAPLWMASVDPGGTAGQKGGTKGTSMERFWLEGEGVESGSSVEPGLRRVCWQEGEGPKRCVLLSVSNGDQLQTERLSTLSLWSVGLGVGVSRWGELGVEGDTSQTRWEGTALNAEITRKLITGPEEGTYLGPAVQLKYGYSDPAEPGYDTTRSFLAELALGLSGSWRMPTTVPLSVLAGGYASTTYLYNYRYSNQVVTVGGSTRVGVNWAPTAGSRVVLSWDGNLVYADLDCNPELANYNGGDNEWAPGCDQVSPGQYQPDPGLNLLSSFSLGWNFSF